MRLFGGMDGSSSLTVQKREKRFSCADCLMDDLYLMMTTGGSCLQQLNMVLLICTKV